MAEPWVLVSAPLLLALAWLAWRAARGRLPPRPVLNAAFSALLLVYLLATAGLGLFWVAQQHLPVFDWHYLFGYATLVLVTVHLVFNARQLWLHLVRRRVAPAAAPGRRVLARTVGIGAGLAAFGALAFWLGLRQGRTVLQAAAGGAGADGAPAGDGGALAFVERFHALSSHARRELLTRAASTDWGAPPPPFKADDVRLPAVALPRRAPPAPVFGLPQLGALLWHVAGVSLRRGGIAFRTAPSSGALFATELYVATRARPGLAPGLWHHDAAADRLVQLRGGTPDGPLLPAGADLAIWATAVFRRSGHKYGDRTYRYVLADLGHALENLRQAAAALGGAALLEPRFDDAAAAQALGVDGEEEGVLACVWLVAGAAPRPPVPGAGTGWEPAPPAAAPAPTGVTAAMHRASALGRRASARAGPPPVPAPPGRAAAAADTAARVPLPDGVPPAADALALIAARRSLRRYRADAVTPAQLAALLRAMTAPLPQLCDALRVHLVSHRVQGIERAAWAYDAAAHALVRGARHDAASLDRRSRAAALDQQVIGDAAVVFVLVLERAALATAPDGPARAYRHAFIEAGLLGERLYLQAQALGLGVCAVGAFYDDEVAALIGIDLAQHWPLHIAALGVPA